MPILYSVVASDETIVAKHAACDGNFCEITDVILSKVLNTNAKMTYLHGSYLFHFIANENNVFLCITDKACQRSRAFLFLNEIKRKYESNKGDLNRVLSEEMYRYSEDYSTIIIRDGELDDINTIRVEDSESIIGEKMLVVRNPDNVEYTSISYAKSHAEDVQLTGELGKNPESHVMFYAVLTVIGIIVYILGPSPYNHLLILIIGIKLCLFN